MLRYADRTAAQPVKTGASGAARPHPRRAPPQRPALWHALQLRAAQAARPEEAPATTSAGGLPHSLKAGVERLSGLAMDDVRVHRNSGEPAKLGALAYAKGSDIHLGPGQERHLPHEAWHVVQQKQRRVSATRQRKGPVPVNDDRALEREADAMGARAARAGASPEAAVHAPLTARPAAAADRAVAQLTTEVDVKRTQKLVKDTPQGKLTGTTFAWQSKFAVDIVKEGVLVTIRIKADIDPKLFQTVWAPQVAGQWSNRFMMKVGSKTYPILVQLVQVDKGEHYAVKAVQSESALKSGARGHFGTQSMTEWGVHDTTNIAHEVGHMLGNVDEYGIVEAEGETRDYLTKPSTTIMAVSVNNPVAEHYALIQQAAEAELKKLGLLTEKSNVIPDVSSRLGQEAPKPLSLSELQSASSGLKKAPVKSDPKKDEPKPEFLGMLSQLKPPPKPEVEKQPQPVPSSSKADANRKQYELDMKVMLANLQKARQKFVLHKDSWVVEWLCRSIEKIIEQYKEEFEPEGPLPRRWCVQATGGVLQDIEVAIGEKHLEGPRPGFMDEKK